MTYRTAGAASASWLATGGELLLLVWSVPVVILLVGLPMAAAVRLIVEIVTRISS